MEEAIGKALRVLGYMEIRPNQKLVVTLYLSGKDVLFFSPTGSGKSLTFEIAPFVFKFLSQNDMELLTVIVVSPLVALMQNFIMLFCSLQNQQKRVSGLCICKM